MKKSVVITPSAAPPAGSSGAGYNLSPIMGRLTRPAWPLGTHEGQELRGSGYGDKGGKGFRWRQRFTGV